MKMCSHPLSLRLANWNQGNTSDRDMFEICTSPRLRQTGVTHAQWHKMWSFIFAVCPQRGQRSSSWMCLLASSAFTSRYLSKNRHIKIFVVFLSTRESQIVIRILLSEALTSSFSRFWRRWYPFLTEYSQETQISTLIHLVSLSYKRQRIDLFNVRQGKFALAHLASKIEW